MRKRFNSIKAVLLLLTICLCFKGFAQDAVNYQMPPKDIVDLLLAKPTPSVNIDSKAQWMLLSERNSYPSVEELGQPEVRIAGLRLNTNNFSPTRQTYINNFTLKNIITNKEYKLVGLPANMLASNIRWNDSETKIAFTNTTGSRVDAYVIDVATQKVIKANKQALNIITGGSIAWYDDNTLMYKVATALPSAVPKKPITPGIEFIK